MNVPPDGVPARAPGSPDNAHDTLKNEHDATILVVDDEPELCRALSKLLSRNGYHVLTAGNGEEGLAVRILTRKRSELRGGPDTILLLHEEDDLSWERGEPH